MSSDKQTDKPPEQISDNITTNTHIETTNLEENNIEVHHHAHDPAAPHHKKNWKNSFSATSRPLPDVA